MRKRTKIGLIVVIVIVGILGISYGQSAFRQYFTVGNAMQKYTDSQDGFSIVYPGNWTSHPLKNATAAAYFVNEAANKPAVFSISVDYPKNMNMSAVAALNDYNNATLLGKPPAGYSISQNLECHKFKVENKRACSEMITHVNATNGVSLTLEIDTLINGKIFVFIMVASPHDFDSFMPIFQAMLNSFKSL